MSGMTRIIGMLALAIALPAKADDQPGPAGIIGVKIAVKDFQKTVDFYSKLGMKLGVKYRPWEQEMRAENGQGPRLILMLNDTAPEKREPGGTMLMIVVPNVQVTAKMLKDAGYPVAGEPHLTPRAAALVVKDPDGDDVELLSSLPR